MKILLLSFIFLITSCSKENNPISQFFPEKTTEIFREYEAKVVTTTPVNTPPVIFPELTNDKTQPINLTIRNSSTEGELIMNTLSINFEGLTSVSNGCPSTGLKPKSTCTLRFNYAAKDKPEGIYSGSITLDGIEIMIQIPIIPAIVAPDVNVTPTPLSIDFGVLDQNSSSVTRNISYKNNLSKAVSGELVTFESNPSDWTILSNSCGTLSAKGTCTLRLSLNPKGKSGNLANAVLFAGTRVPLSAQVQGPPPPPVLVENIISNFELVNFGNLTPSQSSTIQSIVFTNLSNISINIPTINSNPYFSILSDSCSNRQIGVKSTCTVRMIFNAGEKPFGPHNGTLSLGSRTVNLIANIIENTPVLSCSDQDAVSNGWNISNFSSISGTKISADVSQCNISACLPSFELNISTKSCDLIPVITYQSLDTTPSCSSLNLQACDGVQSISTSYVCQKFINDVLDSSYVSNPSDCTPSNLAPVSCFSPSGLKSIWIVGGERIYSCGEGDTTIESPSTVACLEPDYIPNNDLKICEESNNFSILPRAFGEIRPIGEAIGQVRFAVQNDKIMVAGIFQSINGVSSGNIARLNSNSTVDTSFNETGSGLSHQINLVTHIETDSLGRIIVLGNFNTYNGQISNRLVRILPNGDRDQSFIVNSGFSSIPTKFALQSDGKILVIGGSTINYQGNQRNRLLRIDSAGSFDNSFPNIFFDGDIRDIFVDTDDSIYLVGDFTSPTNRIVKLTQNGTIDSSFVVGSGFNNRVGSINKMENEIFITGEFNQYKGVNTGNFLKLDLQGNRIESFNSNNNILGYDSSIGLLKSIFLDNGDIIIGGKSGRCVNSYNLVPIGCILKLNSSGNIDMIFNDNIPPNLQSVNDLIILNNKIYVAGTYPSETLSEQIDGMFSLNFNGTRENTLFVEQTGAGYTFGAISGIKISESEDILVNRGSSIYKFNENSTGLEIGDLIGSVFVDNESSFGVIKKILELPNGKFLIGGNFNIFKDKNNQNRNVSNLIRLNRDGSYDSNFNSVGNIIINDIEFFNNKIYTIGSGMRRLNENGVVDTTFTSPFSPSSTLNRIKLYNNDFFIANNTTGSPNGGSMHKMSANGTIDQNFYVYSAGNGSDFVFFNNRIVLNTNGSLLDLPITGGVAQGFIQGYGSGKGVSTIDVFDNKLLITFDSSSPIQAGMDLLDTSFTKDTSFISGISKNLNFELKNNRVLGTIIENNKLYLLGPTRYQKRYFRGIIKINKNGTLYFPE